jgi:hypothetical protein
MAWQCCVPVCIRSQGLRHRPDCDPSISHCYERVLQLVATWHQEAPSVQGNEVLKNVGEILKELPAFIITRNVVNMRSANRRVGATGTGTGTGTIAHHLGAPKVDMIQYSTPVPLSAPTTFDHFDNSSCRCQCPQSRYLTVLRGSRSVALPLNDH